MPSQASESKESALRSQVDPAHFPVHNMRPAQALAADIKASPLRFFGQLVQAASQEFLAGLGVPVSMISQPVNKPERVLHAHGRSSTANPASDS